MNTCERCGMSWVPAERPVEPMPGVWTTGRVSTHICPEPYDIDTARALLDFYVSAGISIRRRVSRALQLGLEA